MKRKQVLSLLFASFSVFGLAGCGNNSEPEEQKVEEVKEEKEPVKEEVKEEIKEEKAELIEDKTIYKIITDNYEEIGDYVIIDLVPKDAVGKETKTSNSFDNGTYEEEVEVVYENGLRLLLEKKSAEALFEVVDKINVKVSYEEAVGENLEKFYGLELADFAKKLLSAEDVAKIEADFEADKVSKEERDMTIYHKILDPENEETTSKFADKYKNKYTKLYEKVVEKLDDSTKKELMESLKKYNNIYILRECEAFDKETNESYGIEDATDLKKIKSSVNRAIREKHNEEEKEAEQLYAGSCTHITDLETGKVYTTGMAMNAGIKNNTASVKTIEVIEKADNNVGFTSMMVDLNSGEEVKFGVNVLIKIVSNVNSSEAIEVETIVKDISKDTQKNSEKSENSENNSENKNESKNDNNNSNGEAWQNVFTSDSGDNDENGAWNNSFSSGSTDIGEDGPWNNTFGTGSDDIGEDGPWNNKFDSNTDIDNSDNAAWKNVF